MVLDLGECLNAGYMVTVVFARGGNYLGISPTLLGRLPVQCLTVHFLEHAQDDSSCEQVLVINF